MSFVLGTIVPSMPHVLVVADGAWVRNDVRAALGDDAYRLTEVDDPRAAVDTWADDRPDVVLTDLQIGSMGGMAVTRALRDAASGAGEAPPPMVLLLDRGADSFLAGRSGADAWLRKPFTSHELRTTIAEVMASASAEDDEDDS
jgi:CheY-like chemotaxis protein